MHEVSGGAESVTRRIAESRAAIDRLRDELAYVEGQIAAHRRGPALGPRALGAAAGTVLGVAAAFSIAIPSCVSNEEIRRVPSPAGDVDAIVMESNGGATTAFGYGIRLGPPGGAPGRAIEVAGFYAAQTPCARGVDLRWTSVDTLRIAYGEARMANVVRSVLDVGGRTVHVVVQQGVRTCEAEDDAGP
jgi:hypothetical protein